ncbi:MAG: site-specific integrase [Hyphomicrobium sp.]|mgnify:FL=1|nr:site-specific integrase [Hyphomicrobium sp.]
MATFMRLQSGQWRAQVRRQGHVVSRTFRLKADAQSWAREQESRIERGQAPLTKPEMPRETFADLIDLHLTDLKELGRPIGRSKDSALDQLRRKIGSRPIGQLTRDNLVDFAKRRAKEGAGPVTIGMDIGFIGTVLQHAAAVYGINVPSEEIRLARVALNLLGLIAKSNERDRRPTQNELDMIITTAENNPRQIIPLSLIVKVAVATAMRQDEICRILIEDFNPTSSTQLIRERKHPREKASNNQVIPLVADTGYDACALISEQINKTRRNGGYIFPYDGRSVGSAFRRVCRDLGIEDLHFHDLRHEAISRLFEADWDIPQVAAVSGHKDWKMLQRYTHLRPSFIASRAGAAHRLSAKLRHRAAASALQTGGQARG